MKRFLFAGLLALLPTLASAQCNGVFPNNTVCGNITGTGNLPRATNPSAFLGAAGGTNGQIQYNNGGALGGFTMSGDVTVSTATGVATIQPNAVGTAELAANAIPVLPSRAAAAALDLTAYTSVRTLGYATPGDGGGAVFLKAGATPFRDSYITAGSIVGGSAYTNGTYNNVRFTGGTYVGCTAAVTIAGGAMTVVNFTGTYCSGYAVGDVLIPVQADVGGTGSGATLTVTTISTATASFTDSAANRWQYVPDIGSNPNVLQFGAKLDWNAVDATATNDILAFRSAMAFANFPTGSSQTLVQGNKVIVPRGAAYLCAGGTPFTTLVVPHGVNIEGGSIGTSSLKQCAGEDSASHFITLCDPMQNASTLNGGGQFGCKLTRIQLLADGAASGGASAVYSKSGQQFTLLDEVYIQPVGRRCLTYTVGVGGAANAIFNTVDCEVSSTTLNDAVNISSSGTQIMMRDWNVGCAPGVCSATYGINITSGLLILDGAHFEQWANAIRIATTDAAHLHSLRNITINNACVNGITLDATNPNNTELVENVQSSCSTATVLNGHSSGSNVTGHIMAQRVFNP